MFEFDWVPEPFRRAEEFASAFLERGAPIKEVGDPDYSDLIGEIPAALRVAPPDIGYVAALRMRLIAAADQRPTESALLDLWRRPRFILGAASVVSAAAVIVFVARGRGVGRAA